MVKIDLNECRRMFGKLGYLTENLDEYTPIPYDEDKFNSSFEDEVKQVLAEKVSRLRYGTLPPTDVYAGDLMHEAAERFDWNDILSTDQYEASDECRHYLNSFLGWLDDYYPYDAGMLVDDPDTYANEEGEVTFKSLIYLDVEEKEAFVKSMHEEQRAELTKQWVYSLLSNESYDTNERGLLYVERKIAVDDINELNLDKFGDFWTWAENGGKVYNGDDRQGVPVLFRGCVSPQSVDWGKCIYFAVMDSMAMDEYEWALDGPVEIDEIIVGKTNILKQPCLTEVHHTSWY